MAKGRPWAEWEIQYLRDNWPQTSEAEIATALGRTRQAVSIKRHLAGIEIDPADWSPEEDTYIRENWRQQTEEEIASALNRTPHAIHWRGASLGLIRRKPPESKRTWTAEENEYLAENWGVVSVKTMCKRLNRTEASIVTQKNKLGLGAFLDCGDYITLSQLLSAVTGSTRTYSYKMTSWVKNRGLPVHNKLVNNTRYRVVYLGEFWEWAEKNRAFIDFSKMEPLALGKEPDWVPEQRRKDFVSYANQRKDPWTPGEDSRLIMLLKQHKYGYAELSDMLRRSAGAIQRRCSDLGIKDRPVRADNHGKDNEWTEADYKALADGIRAGDSYTEIGRAVGRSEKAVRGKVYFVYLTENADKIRAMMGDGGWGDGAPTPTVKQAMNLSRCRTAVKKDLSALLAVLYRRRNELGYEPYWQKSMCIHWHEIKGCTAGCTNCDSCTEFKRIKPQYCARCGETFFEREENRFCQPCRTARKKAAQRKFMRCQAAVRRRA